MTYFEIFDTLTAEQQVRLLQLLTEWQKRLERRFGMEKGKKPATAAPVRQGEQSRDLTKPFLSV